MRNILKTSCEEIVIPLRKRGFTPVQIFTMIRELYLNFPYQSETITKLSQQKTQQVSSSKEEGA